MGNDLAEVLDHYIKYHFKVIRFEVEDAQLPATLRGNSIIQFAGFQVPDFHDSEF